MKKVLVSGLMAICVIALAQQQASAWSKCNFGIGLNIGWEGANNSFLWGVMKGGPAPCQQADGAYAGFPGGGGMAAMPMASRWNARHTWLIAASGVKCSSPKSAPLL